MTCFDGVCVLTSRPFQCVDPTPGPCMYCASSGHECKITMARKQRPFYYASEEQFRWLQIIVGRIAPQINTNDVAQLQELAESLAGTNEAGVVKQEPPSAQRAEDSPENDPASVDEPGEGEEGIEGVVDGFGTLMLDPLGRESPLLLSSYRFYI